MSVVQKDYGNVSEKVKTTRPRVKSGACHYAEEVRVAFEDCKDARAVADELARLLDCSPTDFGYGEQEGTPVDICVEDAIIECALAIAHLKLSLPLPRRPAEEIPPRPPGEEAITLPDGETTVVLRPGDHTLEARRGDVYGSINIDPSRPQAPYGVGIQVDNVATHLNSYADPKLAFDALIAKMAGAADAAAARRRRETVEKSERAVIAERRDEAWDRLRRFVSSSLQK